MAKEFDWKRSAGGDSAHKAAFHRAARGRLKALAEELGLDDDSFEIRSNKGGPAVSGEVTLHHDKVYIQASQPFSGSDTGLLIRTCEGRKDYTGGQNNMIPLSALDDAEALAAKVRRIQPDLADTPSFRM